MHKQQYNVVFLALTLSFASAVAAAANLNIAPAEEIAALPAARGKGYLGLALRDQEAIDAIYNTKQLSDIAYSINELDTGTLASYKNMVRLQLYLYKQFIDKFDVNDKYVFNVAYYFNQIQKHRYYNKLSAEAKSVLKGFIAELPPTLNYLFFQPYFCLYNNKYSEYMFAGSNADAQRRYIFLWNTPNVVKSDAPWVPQISDVSKNGELKLKFALKNYSTKLYLYLERKKQSLMNMVAAWRSGAQPFHSEWSVQLNFDQLIFTQNGYVMCASDELYDRSHRYVYGYMDDSKYSSMSSACQWYARECS